MLVGTKNTRFKRKILIILDLRNYFFPTYLQLWTVNKQRLCGFLLISFDIPEFQKGLSILERENVPFDLGINDAILKFVPEIAKRFPKLKMVIDHLAKPEVKRDEGYFRQWKAEINEITKHPNVFMKLSGICTNSIKINRPVYNKSTVLPLIIPAL